MRVLAVDYGDRRTGLAFSDLGGVLCGEAFTVEEWDPEHLAGRIADECREKTQEKRGRPGRRPHPGELPRLRTHMKSKIPRSL